jgi:hypothetical protein
MVFEVATTKLLFVVTALAVCDTMETSYACMRN